MPGRNRRGGRGRGITGATRATRGTSTSVRARGAGGCDPPDPPAPSRVDPTELSNADSSETPTLQGPESSKPIQSGSEEEGVQVIVLGPSGGPLEDTVTGFLVRSKDFKWQENSMLAVDAGTLLAGIYKSLCGKASIAESPFAGLPFESSSGGFNPKEIASYIFQQMIAAICITHPHLDHVSGFAINAAHLKANSGRKKKLAGLEGVITALKTHVFNGIIWPNFTDEDDGIGLFRLERLEEGNLVPPRQDYGDYISLCRGLEVKAFKLNHGCGPDRGTLHSMNPKPRTESTAFFVRDIKTGREIIIFGDVEPDSLVSEEQQRTRQVWEAAAPKFVNGHLRAIFIECSYDDSVTDDALYGHLCPRHLVDELQVLAQLVKQEKVDYSYLASPDAKGKNKRSRDDDNTDLEESFQKKAAFPKLDEDARMATPTENSPIAEPKGGEDTVMTEPMMENYMTGDSMPVDSMLVDSMPVDSMPGNSMPGNSMTGNSMTGYSMTADSLTEPVTDAFTQPFTNLPVEDQLAIAGTQAGAASDDMMEQTLSALVPNALEGLSVYLIHIKDSMQGPNPGERILKEVRSHVKEAALGCFVDVVTAGQSISL